MRLGSLVMLNSMQKNKKDIAEFLGVFFLFLLVALVSFSHIEKSISLMKYLFVYGIRSLSENYSLYQHSFQEFFAKTSLLHTGDSESGWRTVFYLWPLFVFSDLLGGLSLKTMHLFTITTSLVFLGLFYGWVRGAWGREAAFFAAFFLGFSSLFQEIARSGSYDVYSLLIGMIWVICFFHCSRSEKIRDYFLLGLLTGLTWYGYGILRYLTLVLLLQGLFLKGRRRFVVLGVIFAGMAIVLVPGFLMKLEAGHIDLARYHKPFYYLFFDQNTSFHQGQPWTEIGANLVILGKRIFGAPEIMDRPLKDLHASLWNPFLAGPLLIGLWSVWRARRRPQERLLLLLALVIYLAPCLLANHGIRSRRVLLYIIPSYCLIGLGLKEIVAWARRIPRIALKRAVLILLVVVSGVVMAQEVRFFRRSILSSRKDFGFLAFAERIRGTAFRGEMYYLEKKSILRWAREGDVMRVALMDRGRSSFQVMSGGLNSAVPSAWGEFYLSRSPLVSESEFQEWCARHSLTASLIFESPVAGMTGKARGQYFRFYAVESASRVMERKQEERLILWMLKIMP